ncbi:MAG: hypothetical protein Q8L79_03875 [Methylobacter sp.]|uniref:hypothetical protein n=1 Tax=Methylobacter sp. TaxID=2051955 RepID=UPI0027304C1E|nr:hypothetical protein [Methylobacter sp.]MDP1664243.1 hypothetical protein [Methylobacter sp.]
MSESDHHRRLVQALAREISADAIWCNPPIVYCDIQNGIALDVPPIIGNNRPDVFARDLATAALIIGEAKTANDIDNQHTFDQLASFFDYLRSQQQGELWMGVPWLNAGTAIRVCAHMRKKTAAQHVPIRVLSFMIGDTHIRRAWRE